MTAGNMRNDLRNAWSTSFTDMPINLTGASTLALSPDTSDRTS